VDAVGCALLLDTIKYISVLHNRKQTKQIFAQAKKPKAQAKTKISSLHKHNNKHKKTEERNLLLLYFCLQNTIFYA